MIVNRIYEWAHSQPNKTALIHNDVAISYAAFARTIESLRNLLKQQNLPAGQTAIVLVRNLADAWVLVMALRSLGLNTTTVASIAHAEARKLNNVACIVITEAEQGQHKLSGNLLVGTKVITIPEIPADIHAGDLPSPHDQAMFGGHILFTSGTTGTYKRVFQNGLIEEKRNLVRAGQLSFSRETVAHVFEFPLWTGAGFKQPSAAWQVGGCVVLDQRQDMFSYFFKHNITHAFLVPPTFKGLIRSFEKAREISFDQIQLGIMGGFISLKLAEQVVGDLNARLQFQYSSSQFGQTSTFL